MTDIDAKKRQVLTAFGVYQMQTNPGGIGNECTHWIYAALFEARALDHDRALHIGQAAPPYTWGRRVDAAHAQRGDIAQFHGFRNHFFIYLPDVAGGTRWAEATKIRGPNHTGMVFTAPRSGVYYQLESHLHQPGVAVMSIRGNTVFYDSFSIAIPASDFARIKGSRAWPLDIKPSDTDDLLERVDWVELRDQYSITAKAAAALVQTARHGKTPTLAGKDIAVVFQVQSTGQLRFYRPQASADRLRMSADQLATEKASLIKRLIHGGRNGHQASEDDYGGDNKGQRVKDHRFDWSFPQEPSP